MPNVMIKDAYRHPIEEDQYLVVLTPIFAGLVILGYARVTWNKTTHVLTGYKLGVKELDALFAGVGVPETL